MGKRRLSSIVTTVVRSHKLHHSNGARVSLSPTTLDPNPDWDTIQGVHQDVPTMATGTAGRSLDGLVKGAAISTESFWSADLPLWRSGEAQHSEAGPSRSSSIHSRRGTCTPTTLTPPSPTANKLLSPPFDVVSTRLAPSNEPTPPTTYRSAQHLDGQSAADLECTGAPLLSGFQMAGLSASPEQVATSSSARSHPSHASTIPSAFSLNRSTAIPALWSTPSSLQSDPVAAPHPSRPAGPTLARLNTSEMLRTQNASSAASGAVPSTPAIVRKSPSSLKLQLDTSVPRRSATLSSYPHAAKPRFAIPTMEVPRPHHSVKSHGLDALLSSTSDAPDHPRNSNRDAASTLESHEPRTEVIGEDFAFEMSTILPDFLYLGSNVQSENDVAELQAKGVHRILNVACEIDESGPLQLRQRFRRYLKLPMLDSVEAQGVQDNIKQACDFLDDARLRSEPVYVHCRAGKSRSVTIVIAYLIHALRWPLARSYSYVVERRAASSPNIGFVAELMKFEEAELKLARSTGIYGDAPGSSPSQAFPAASDGLTGPAGVGSQHAQARPHQSTPMLAPHGTDTPRTRTSHDLSAPESDHIRGGTLSQSSPDLPSLAFGSH